MDAQTRSFRAKHQQVYSTVRECERYDEELCRRQDHEGNVLAAIRAVAPLSSATSVLGRCL